MSSDSGSEISNRTQHFVISRKLMTDGGDAIERLMSAWKEVAELAGYTQRVNEMLTVFEDVRNERYKKTLVNNDWVPGAGKGTQTHTHTHPHPHTPRTQLCLSVLTPDSLSALCVCLWRAYTPQRAVCICVLCVLCVRW